MSINLLFSVNGSNHTQGSVVFLIIIRVFPKISHSAIVARIVLVEYIIESADELHFC